MRSAIGQQRYSQSCIPNLNHPYILIRLLAIVICVIPSHTHCSPQHEKPLYCGCRCTLTRALLGLVRTLPSAGGGRIGPPPHLSRKPTDIGEKFKRQWKGLDEIFQINFKNLTSRSPVTSQVRSNTKCLTFPFNAFPRQNAGNKRISSRWIDMIRVCDISKHRP